MTYARSTCDSNARESRCEDAIAGSRCGLAGADSVGTLVDISRSCWLNEDNALNVCLTSHARQHDELFSQWISASLNRSNVRS